MREIAEKSDMIHRAETQVANFGDGLFVGGVEKPYNALTQLTNHVANAHLPEMHIVDEKKANNTVAGKVGQAVGQIADVGVALASTTGAGLLLTGGEMSMPIVGAIGLGAYDGLFKATPVNSKHMVQDRIAAGAVGAVEGYAAGLLAERLFL
jgi:hypothetical protein